MNLHEECLLKYLLNPLDLFNSTEYQDKDILKINKLIEEKFDFNHENLIKDFMKTAEKGQCEGYSVSWTTSERKSFDTKRFVAENPEIDLSPYYNTTSLRTFRANKRKGK